MWLCVAGLVFPDVSETLHSSKQDRGGNIKFRMNELPLFTPTIAFSTIFVFLREVLILVNLRRSPTTSCRQDKCLSATFSTRKHTWISLGTIPGPKV